MSLPSHWQDQRGGKNETATPPKSPQNLNPKVLAILACYMVCRLPCCLWPHIFTCVPISQTYRLARSSLRLLCRSVCAFLITYVPLGLRCLIYSTNFVSFLIVIFTPLQGFFNLLIILKCRMGNLSSQHPSWSCSRKFQEAITMDRWWDQVSRSQGGEYLIYSLVA